MESSGIKGSLFASPEVSRSPEKINPRKYQALRDNLILESRRDRLRGVAPQGSLLQLALRC